MDLTFTQEQVLLRDTLRDVCTRYSPPEAVRELEDDPTGFREQFWKELVTLGLTGLIIPEQLGGAGGSLLDLVVAYEEFGRALAPSPHFVSCVLAAGALRAAMDHDDADGADLVHRIGSGDAIVSVAWFEPGRGDDEDGITTEAARDGDGWRLTGEKILVPFASSAEQLLVLARTAQGVSLFLTATADASLEQQTTMGSDASYRVAFDRTPATPVGADGDGWLIWNEAMIDGLVALAAYANGAAERAHEMAVDYAKERVQFDRPIGGFQAVAHPLADMATEIAGSKVLAYEAAWARDAGRDASVLAAMAKMYAADVFKRATKWGQQIFGGIGFTREIDMQLYFRRAKQLEITWWGPRYLEGRIAAAELDAPIPFISIDAGTD